MDRIQASARVDAIGASLDAIPHGILRRLRHVRFVAGVDPLWAGLHGYESFMDGRSYRDTPHCCYPFHLNDRGPTTIVLPVEVTPRVVTHELGHALHEVVAFDHQDLAPVSRYAMNNGMEAFAEAFAAWLHPGEYPWAEEILHRDGRALALFAELSA